MIRKKSRISTRMTAPLEVRFAAESGTVEGYASVFGGPPDSYGDVIAAGAFERTLGEHTAEGTMPAMLWAHDQAKPIGRWLELREDDQGLFVRGALNVATIAGKDAHEHLKQGDVNGLSIGFVVPQDGSRREGPTTILTDIDLMEVSVVAFPANRRARVSGVKAVTSKAELVDLLREAGLPKAAASRVAAGGWPALADEPDETAAVELLLKAIEASTNRFKEFVKWK